MADTTYGFCGSKCKHEVYTKEETKKAAGQVFSDRIATFTYNTGVNGGETDVHTHSYPEGFTRENSIVISVMVNNSSPTATYNYPKVAFSEGEPIIVSLLDDVVQVGINNEKSAYRNFSYKVTIMRID